MRPFKRIATALRRFACLLAAQHNAASARALQAQNARFHAGQMATTASAQVMRYENRCTNQRFNQWL